MDAKEPPAQVTPAEKELGIVRVGKEFGKPVAYYKDGTYSYRVGIEQTKYLR